MLHVNILFYFCFILYFRSSSCLYEDQIGKFDWRQRYIGKLKFSLIDSKSAVKKAYVATEENVIAALSLKSGDIIWRQVLEKGPKGQLQLLHAESEIVTVSGNGGVGPYFVRGWNPTAGHLLYEWIIPVEKSAANLKVLWMCHQEKLFRVYLNEINIGTAEVVVFNVRTGVELDSYWLYLPQVTDTNCKISGGVIICALAEGKLQTIPVVVQGNNSLLLLDTPHPGFQGLSSEESKAITCELNPVGSVTELPAVAMTCGKITTLITIVDKKIVQDTEQFSAASSVSITPYSADNHIKIVASQSNGVIKLSGKILETGEHVPEIESQYQHLYPLADADISSSLCLTRRDHSVSCQLVLSTVDACILFTQTPNKILWTREEALTNILTVDLIDLPVSDIDAAIEKEFDNKEGGFFGMFLRRIVSQILQVRSLLLTILSFGESTPSAGSHANLVRDQFGLHKILVAVTGVGKLYGIDNLSGEIIWQRYLSNVRPFYSLEKPLIPFYVQRSARHLPHPAQCLLLFKSKASDESVFYTFNPINGQPLGDGLVSLGYTVVQSSLLHYTDDEFVKGILLLDSDENVHVYPNHLEPVVIENAKSMFLFTADSDTGLMKGYTLAYSSKKGLVAKVVWQNQLAHKITGLVNKSPLEKVHSQGRVLGDRSVLYKYINPNLVAVITQAEDPVHKNVLSIHLIDIVSGSIVFSVVHKRATEPVHVVHSENWVVYSYFSEKSRRTEIATLELYEGKTQSNTTAFSSLGGAVFPMVERQSFILPSGIDAIKETITEKGITSKHILVALTNGGILEIPWIFLDPRRPLGDIREEGSIPYIPELPIPAEAIINYNQTLYRVRDIHTAPSGLESTCLVFIYGLDLFYTRVAPSKTFDVLKEDFDHILISAVLVALTVAAYATKRLASRKALKQAWK